MNAKEILQASTANNPSFIEEKRTIEVGGKKFTSGGSWLLKRTDTGKYEGTVYISWSSRNGRHRITDWNGNKLATASVGKEWTSNFGDLRQPVWFTYKGIQFYGVWCSKLSQQCLNVREVA